MDVKEVTDELEELAAKIKDYLDSLPKNGDPAFATRNQCGRLIRHDDPAGTQLLIAFGLTGAVLEQTRHFLQALDSPDWPELTADRDALVKFVESL